MTSIGVILNRWHVPPALFDVNMGLVWHAHISLSNLAVNGQHLETELAEQLAAGSVSQTTHMLPQLNVEQHSSEITPTKTNESTIRSVTPQKLNQPSGRNLRSDTFKLQSPRKRAKIAKVLSPEKEDAPSPLMNILLWVGPQQRIKYQQTIPK
ncbi:hypothetical protein J6590_000736 [Homalodisca vitripennis]|nr:hypothetical protein J6590_000736 [Homalodisca vitripennis]